MTTGTPDLLTQRLDRLERGLRWWKVWGSMSAVALAVLAVLGASPALSTPDAVRARSFTLVDAAGNPRAVWLVDDDGAVTLMFFDKGSGPNLLVLRLAQVGGVGLALAS